MAIACGNTGVRWGGASSCRAPFRRRGPLALPMARHRSNVGRWRTRKCRVEEARLRKADVAWSSISPRKSARSSALRARSALPNTLEITIEEFLAKPATTFPNACACFWTPLQQTGTGQAVAESEALHGATSFRFGKHAPQFWEFTPANAKPFELQRNLRPFALLVCETPSSMSTIGGNHAFSSVTPSAVFCARLSRPPFSHPVREQSRCPPAASLSPTNQHRLCHRTSGRLVHIPTAPEVKGAQPADASAKPNHESKECV